MSDRAEFEQKFREQAWGMDIDESVALEIWQSARAHKSDLSDIAQKKLEQMGATVHGVLVKNEAGAWAAVSDAGRVMWLDGFETEAEPDRGGQGAEQIAATLEHTEPKPVGFIPSSGLNNLEAGHPAKIYPVSATPSPFDSHELLFTHPQPAQQGVPDEDALIDWADRTIERLDPNGTGMIYSDLAQAVKELFQAPQPEGDGCCCGETDQAWRLCPEHGPQPPQEDEGDE